MNITELQKGIEKSRWSSASDDIDIDYETLKNVDRIDYFGLNRLGKFDFSFTDNDTVLVYPVMNCLAYMNLTSKEIVSYLKIDESNSIIEKCFVDGDFMTVQMDDEDKRLVVVEFGQKCIKYVVRDGLSMGNLSGLSLSRDGLRLAVVLRLENLIRVTVWSLVDLNRIADLELNSNLSNLLSQKFLKPYF